MSGLTTKARETVRGRSRSRKARAQYDGRTSDELHTSDRADVRNSGNTTEPRMSSPTIPAWHIHKGSVRTSNETPPQMDLAENLDLDDGDDLTRPNYSSTAPRVVDEYTLPTSRGGRIYLRDSDYLSAPSYPLVLTESGDSGKIPLRSLSTYDPTTDTLLKHPQAAERRHPERRPAKQPEKQPQPALTYPYTVPRRKESLPQNRTHRKNKSSTGKSANPQASFGVVREAITPPADSEPMASLPHQSLGADLGTEITQALASLDVNEETTQPVAALPREEVQASEPSEHLRLPEGFNIGNRTETTTIDTKWKPAVTHENVHHQKTEILQEAITRDIHIHHYYTYVQPIKVVEVLPAKHYRMDPATGRKIEIPAPPGWVMPPHLQPRAEDTTNVKAYTRHYLVNDQYPYGISEPPPPENFNVGGGRARTNKYSTRPY